PPATPAATPPAAATPAAAASREQAGDERAEIERALARYATALKDGDMSALKGVWPDLSAERAKTIANSFRFSRAHVVELTIVDLKLAPPTATAVCRRKDHVETKDGQVMDNETKATFELRKSGSAWVISDLR